MRIDPAIAQLRRDPAPQLRAQAALERVRDRWRGQPQMAAISTELERYGGGADFADCPTLGAIFAEPELARRAIDALVVPMVRTLAAHPLGHVPLRHQFAAGLMVLQLASVGRAALSLVCYEDMGQAAARTVCFAGGERRELCLAGAADARFFEIIRAEPQRAAGVPGASIFDREPLNCMVTAPAGTAVATMASSALATNGAFMA